VQTVGATPKEKMNPNNSGPRFWPEVIAAYCFPMVMFALAIIPGFDFSYSGHGGVSWFLVPLCFPSVVLRGLVKITRGTDERRRWYRVFFAKTIPSYIALALPLSWAATTSIRNVFGLEVPTWSFFAIMVSPIPWWYFT
jgi:hypothetical protein